MSNEIVQATHYKTELDYAKEVGKMVVKSGKWPKDWTEDTVAILVMYARDLGIHPVKALMNGFDIIQGKISMKPILMADMIRKSGGSIQILQNDDVACVLKGTRKDNGDTCTIKFSYEDAKKAGLTSKENWNKWRSDMLYSRAMGRLARQLWTDVIGGAYTDGEMEDIKAGTKAPQEPEMAQADFEVTTIVQEQPKIEALPAASSTPTIDDLQKAMFGHHPIGKDELQAFLIDMSQQKQASEEAIIRSALRSEDAMSKFCKALEEWQKQAPESEPEVV